MKIQSLTMIFIIIIIPIIVIFLYYLDLETNTITIQTNYDTKLIEATKEAVEAFEVNTTEWNSQYSTLANSKRRDILSSINVFTEGLANKLGISGTAKENILQYIPAIVFTMYDGYYIYTPTYVPEKITDNKGRQLFYYEDTEKKITKITNEPIQMIGSLTVPGEPIYIAKQNGTPLEYTNKNNNIPDNTEFTTNIYDAEKTYEHMLKTFVPYSTTINTNSKNYVINYSLDNFVRIYDGDGNSKEGYIMEDYGNITIDDKNITYEGASITGETLSENIATYQMKYLDNIQYVTDSYDEKIYYYDNDFFKINDSYKKIKVNSVYETNDSTPREGVYIQSDDVEVKNFKYIYNSNNEKRYYDKDVNRFFSIGDTGERYYLAKCDQGNSQAEFQKILQLNDDKTFKENTIQLNPNTPTEDHTEYQGPIDYSARNFYIETYCFNYWLNEIEKFTENDISEVLANKNKKIIENIENNLKLSLANYSLHSNIDYELPKLSEEDWEQALSNVSIITFFQGVKTGLKTYNNYAIVTSTQNNEYIDENSLYYITTSDSYYHRFGCENIDGGEVKAYRNIEFKPKSYTNGTFYQHWSSDSQSKKQCFDCVVNINNLNENKDFYWVSHYTALARERYIQMGRSKLIN